MKLPCNCMVTSGNFTVTSLFIFIGVESQLPLGEKELIVENCAQPPFSHNLNIFFSKKYTPFSILFYLIVSKSIVHSSCTN